MASTRLPYILPPPPSAHKPQDLTRCPNDLVTLLRNSAKRRASMPLRNVVTAILPFLTIRSTPRTWLRHLPWTQIRPLSSVATPELYTNIALQLNPLGPSPSCSCLGLLPEREVGGEMVLRTVLPGGGIGVPLLASSVLGGTSALLS